VGARRNLLVATALVIVVVGATTVVPSLVGSEDTPERTGVDATAASTAPSTDVPEAGATDGPAEDEPATTTTTAPPRPPANTLRMQKFTTITGDISPKSVVASGTGFVTAQNMMYTHTMTAYDRDGNLVATVPDTVTLSEFGIDKPGQYRGAPVEAAFTHDGQHVYISNYAMYGPGFREGSDSCTPASNVPPSYLYRISTTDWTIDQVAPVGATPKYVAVTPDDTRVLTSNWCTFDLSVTDTATGAEITRIPMGRYPRGIVITPDGRTAFVAIMGSTNIARVNLDDYSVQMITGVGQGPRHLVMSPDGSTIYATLNSEGSVAKIDAASGAVIKKVRTGSQPRSMAISGDGTSLYVVNYDSSTVTKLDAATMTEIQTLPSGHHPIGITYDESTGRVWEANYSGSIVVYDEVAPA
jgi:YVTN family beta-propeller protein